MKSSKLARIALTVAGTVCCLPLLLSTAHAFGGAPGGPFSNGSYFPNDGTFSAVITGEDMIGTIQFSTTSASASTGVSTIYNQGNTYLGNSSGIIDPSRNTMAVTFQGSIPGQGQQEINVQTPVTTQVTTFVTTNGTVTPVQTESTTFQNTRTILYFDSLYCNGAATCKTSNAYPNQKFQGNGQVEFQNLVFTGNTPFLDAVDKNITVSGVRISDIATVFNSSTITPPSVNEFSVLIQ